MDTKVLLVLHSVLYLTFIIILRPYYYVIFTYIDIGMQKLFAVCHGNPYLFW